MKKVIALPRTIYRYHHAKRVIIDAWKVRFKREQSFSALKLRALKVEESVSDFMEVDPRTSSSPSPS